MVEITANMLSTEDEDTPPEELIYNIKMLSGGRLSLMKKFWMDIRNFSQADINEERVFFLDEGELQDQFLKLSVT